jgi:hypothetical protein
MKLRGVACLLSALAIALSASNPAAASSGTTSCLGSSDSLGPTGPPAACTRVWTCKAAFCWYQGFLSLLGSSANKQRRSITAEAAIIGLPAGIGLPWFQTLKCTWSTSDRGSSGSVGGCSVVANYRRVSSGYRVNVTCWMPALLVLRPYTGGYVSCGVHWYS